MRQIKVIEVCANTESFENLVNTFFKEKAGMITQSHFEVQKREELFEGSKYDEIYYTAIIEYEKQNIHESKIIRWKQIYDIIKYRLESDNSISSNEFDDFNILVKYIKYLEEKLGVRV
jgi:hypothetical protein